MRSLGILLLSSLAACQGIQPTEFATFDSVVQPTSSRSNNGDDWFQSAIERVVPIASKACQEKRKSQNAVTCDFRIIESKTKCTLANAFQSVEEGRPVIEVNRCLLDKVRNEDEIAFVLAHEAAHHIANHIGKLNARQNNFSSDPSSGAVFSATSSSFKRKRVELEADAIGAIISYHAGYDPIHGSQVIKLVTPFGSQVSKTHPRVSPRLNLVQDVVNKLEAHGSVQF